MQWKPRFTIYTLYVCQSRKVKSEVKHQGPKSHHCSVPIPWWRRCAILEIGGVLWPIGGRFCQKKMVRFFKEGKFASLPRGIDAPWLQRAHEWHKHLRYHHFFVYVHCKLLKDSYFTINISIVVQHHVLRLFKLLSQDNRKIIVKAFILVHCHKIVVRYKTVVRRFVSVEPLGLFIVFGGARKLIQHRPGRTQVTDSSGTVWCRSAYAISRA